MSNETEVSGPQGHESFWVIVLIDPATGGIHSFHACGDPNPKNEARIWGAIIRDGWTRRMFVMAYNIWDAMSQARDKGILMQDSR